MAVIIDLGDADNRIGADGDNDDDDWAADNKQSSNCGLSWSPTSDNTPLRANISHLLIAPHCQLQQRHVLQTNSRAQK